MRIRFLGIVGSMCVLMLGCGAGPPDADSLRDSFAEQIAAVSSVSNFDRNGEELTFTGPNGSGGQAAWLVSIDSAIVESSEGEDLPLQGRVVSSWYADGELIQPVGSISRLPSEFLDTGIAQECWGIWNEAERHWTW